MKWTVQNLALALAGMVSTAGLGGCYVHDTRPGAYYAQPRGQAYAQPQVSVSVGTPTYAYPTTAAPDPIYEDMPPAPAYGYVWIDGYWDWNGYEWQWAPGHWESPRVDYVYVQPYYTYESNNYIYAPGHWQHRRQLPPNVYVRDHRDGRPTTGYYQRGNTYVIPSRTRDHRSDPQQPNQPGRVVIPSNPGRQQPTPGRVIIPSAPSNNTGGYQQSQPGRVVIPNNQGGYAPQPTPGRVIIPSAPSNNGGNGGYQQQPQPQPGQVVIPSNEGGNGYRQPPPARGDGGAQPGRVIQNNPAPARQERTVIPAQPSGRPPVQVQPGRVVTPNQPPPAAAPPPPPPPSSSGRVVIPSSSQSPPPAPAPPRDAGKQTDPPSNSKVRDHRK